MCAISHDCLDGEVSADELTSDERLHLEELQAVVRQSVALLLGERSPDVVATVMERVRERESEAPGLLSGLRRLRANLIITVEGASRWMWTSRPVRLRPALVLAVFMSAALAIGTSSRWMAAPRDPDAALLSGQTGGTVLLVRFQLEASGASSVSLAGTFSGWQPRYELTETEPGHWSALVPLRPGVHDYSFVINGERWVTDPNAPSVDDGFGGLNSRIALMAPASQDIGESL